MVMMIVIMGLLIRNQFLRWFRQVGLIKIAIFSRRWIGSELKLRTRNQDPIKYISSWLYKNVYNNHVSFILCCSRLYPLSSFIVSFPFRFECVLPHRAICSGCTFFRSFSVIECTQNRLKFWIWRRIKSDSGILKIEVILTGPTVRLMTGQSWVHF